MRPWAGFVAVAGLLLPLVVGACGMPTSASQEGAIHPDSKVIALDYKIEPIAARNSGLAASTPESPTLVAVEAPRTPTPVVRTPVAGTPQSGNAATPTIAPTTVSTGVATAQTSLLNVTVTGTPGTLTPTATGTPATATPTPAASVAGALAPTGSFAGDALSALNAERGRRGLSPLTFNPQLAVAAATYAQYMATANFFGHNGPDGSSPSSRVARAGYAGSWRGETLAAGQTSGAAVIEVWLNSPSHRAIILDSGATEAGIGYYFDAGDTYGHYWVLHVGTP